MSGLRLSRWGFGVLLLGAALQACDCGTPETSCDDITLKFEAPQAGATVTSPFDVTVRASDADGLAWSFDSATLTSGALSADGVVAGATAKFEAIELPAGPQTLTARVVKDACVRTADLTVTVRTETCTTPALTAVSFPQDQSNDGILNAAELPAGAQLQVRVAAECTSGIQVRVMRGAQVVGGPTAFSNGVALVTLPSLPDVDSGVYDLEAELLRDGQPVGARLGGSIRVERALPACENTTLAVQGPKQGGTGAEHTLTATGTTTGVAAEFRLDGAQLMASTPAQGEVSASWSVQKSGDNTYQVELRCRDNFGNVATSTRAVRVDYKPPVVTVNAPQAGDAGVATVTESPTRVIVVTDAEDGAEACAFRVQGATRTAVGCTTVSQGLADFDVPFAVDGSYVIEVQVVDLAGNDASDSVSVEAVLSGCGLAFSRPASCPALLTASQVTNGVYLFQTQSNPSCAGQQVRLSMQAWQQDGSLGPSSAVAQGAVAANGTAAVSGPVANGRYLYTAEVDNLATGASRATCDVTVDLDGPSITNPVAPLAGSPYTIVAAAQDTQPSTCGAQRALAFSAIIPPGGRADVCTTQGIDSCTGQTRPTSAACGAGWYVMQTNVGTSTSGFTFSEGQYSIKVVVTSGSVTSASAPLPLFVDVTRPCVVKHPAPWPQDTAGGVANGMLNAAELNGAPPQLRFTLGCGDTGVGTLSATTPVVVRQLVNGNPTGSFTVPADVSVSGNTVTVNLTQGVAAEKDYEFFVELTDQVGNKNVYSGQVSDPARHDVRIDTVAPACSIVAPGAGDTLLGLAEAPGGQLSVTVASSEDVDTDGVSVTLAGPMSTTRLLTPTAPAYQAQTSFPVSGTAAWTLAATCTDEAGNATPATGRSFTLDLDAPSCTIVAPTGAAPYATNDLTTTVNVTGGDGQVVACASNGSDLTPQLLVSGGVASGTLSYPNGTQTVSCSVTDPAGNEGSCSMPGVVVSSTSCAFLLTSTQTTASGEWHNRSNTGALTATTGSATVTARTSDCGAGRTVTLVRAEPTAGTPATATTNGTGDVSFANVVVADGERWTVTIDNGAGLVTTRSFRVGLVAPAATGVQVGGATVANGANLFFVASSGNRNVETATPGYFADTNAAADGAQMTASAGAVSGAVKAGLPGTAQLVFRGAVVASQNITADGQSVVFAGATLPHGEAGALELHVRDTAGNDTTALAANATVDVIAPAAPAVTQTLTSARSARVSLQWAPTYDDGSDATSGGHAGYDVRWTTSSVVANNQMATSADYFGSSSKQDTVEPWSASTINHIVDLPPINRYYLAVRARDAVGNYSAFVAPTGLDNFWSQVTISNPSTDANAAAHGFGAYTIVADSLNGDSSPDIVIAAPTRGPANQQNIGSVFIYFGGVTGDTNTCVAPACQELRPYDEASGQFGLDINASGNVGDAPGATKTDLLIAQPTYQTNVGRAFLYFGGSGNTIDATKYIEFRGTANSLLGSTARIIKDIDGDGLDEVAISAHGENSNQGRVYIFKGRSADPAFNAATPGANWFNSRTALDGAVPYIPTSAATWVLDGPTPVLSGGNQFARMRWGMMSIGDITGDGRSEFVVPMSKEVDGGNRLLIYSGSDVAAATAPVPATAALQPLVGPVPPTYLGQVYGFGCAAVAGNFTGALGVDLAVGYPQTSKLYIYADLTGTGVAGGNPSQVISGTGSFWAWHLSVGDLNGDGRGDLSVGSGLSGAGNVWVLWQRPSGFDSSIDGVTPQFWVSAFDRSSAGAFWGRNVLIGDSNNDSVLDLFAGDQSLGVVRIWR